MKKTVLFALLAFIAATAFAQQPVVAAKAQYMLIIRTNTDFKFPSDTAVKIYARKWQDYLALLTKSGELVGEFSLARTGATISSRHRTVKMKALEVEDRILSSILVIRADNIENAKTVAGRCPAYDAGGNVEIRPVVSSETH